MSDWAILNADAKTYDMLNENHFCSDSACWDCNPETSMGTCCPHCPGYEGDK